MGRAGRSQRGLTVTFDPFIDGAASLAKITDTHDLAKGGHRDDESSAFAMLVPKGWLSATTFSGIECGLGKAVPLGAFLLRAEEASPMIVVRCTRFGAEIGCEDFLRYECESDGWRVSASRWIEGAFGPRFEIASHRPEDDPELRLSTALVDNRRLFVIDAICPSRWWAWFHLLQWPCARSFALFAPSGVERLGRTTMVRADGLTFELPADWRCDLDEGGRIHARLDDAGRRIAWLGLRRPPVCPGSRGSSAPDADVHVRRMSSQLERQHVIVHSVTPATPPQEHGNTVASALATFEYDVTSAGTRRVLRSALLRMRGVDIEVLCDGPRRSDDAPGWHRAKRAFDLAALTLRHA